MGTRPICKGARSSRSCSRRSCSPRSRQLRGRFPSPCAGAGDVYQGSHTWNIRRRAEGWRHILDTLRPDIAFIQESPTPPESVAASLVVYQPIEQTGATRPWGNAIYARNGGLRRIDVDTKWRPSSFLAPRLSTVFPTHLLFSVVRAFVQTGDRHANSSLSKLGCYRAAGQKGAFTSSRCRC